VALDPAGDFKLQQHHTTMRGEVPDRRIRSSIETGAGLSRA